MDGARVQERSSIDGRSVCLHAGIRPVGATLVSLTSMESAGRISMTSAGLKDLLPVGFDRPRFDPFCHRLSITLASFGGATLRWTGGRRRSIGFSVL